MEETNGPEFRNVAGLFASDCKDECQRIPVKKWSDKFMTYNVK